MQHFVRRLLSLHQKHGLVVGAGLVFWICLLVALRLQTVVPLHYVMHDPSVVAHYPLYYGALSNVGVIFWGASAAVCLLSVALLKILQPGSEAARFFTAFGWLNVALCLDDLFLFHETIFPKWVRSPSGSHAAEGAVLVAYAVIFSHLVIRFRHLLLRTKPILFGLSFLLFSVSLGVDTLPLPADLSIDNESLIEDGSKLLAIFIWFMYFLWAAVELVIASVGNAVAQLPEFAGLPSAEAAREAAALRFFRGDSIGETPIALNAPSPQRRQ